MQPDDKERVTSLFSRAAPTYDTVGPRHFVYFARRLVEFVGFERGSRVLDVATGTGAVLVAAAERLGEAGQVIGIDLSSAMLERASSEIARRGLGTAQLKLMDAEALDFPDDSFDVVLCAFAFLGFPDSARALRGFRRVLKPGGRLGFVDAFGWFFQHDPRWKPQEEIFRSLGALRETGPGMSGRHELVALLRDGGFAAVEAIEDAFPLAFRDENEWWQWMWSHGSRALLEAVPEPRREELRTALMTSLAGCTEPDGTIHGTLRAALTRARKPAVAP